MMCALEPSADPIADSVADTIGEEGADAINIGGAAPPAAEPADEAKREDKKWSPPCWATTGPLTSPWRYASGLVSCTGTWPRGQSPAATPWSITNGREDAEHVAPIVVDGPRLATGPATA